MSVSTNGIIFYGLLFDEGFEFPWDDDDDSLDGWWHGLKNPNYPYTSDGAYKDEIDSRDHPMVLAYVESRIAWEAANPVPVELVNYCSESVPMYGLAVPGTVIECRRGYPIEISTSTIDWDVTKERLMWEFLEEYKIKYEGNLKWYLASYWGQ
jgi:hypothetical protein